MMINGGTEVTSGPILSNALGNLTTAANGLAGMTANFTVTNLSSLDLGGMTLNPGVYSFSSSANQALDTVLTLDADGENNAFWVILVQSSLTFGANDVITISDPGSNDGIFWVTETGSVTFGADDQLLGNFISDQSITIASSDTLSGSVLAMQGSVTSLDNTDTINADNYAGGLTYAADGTTVVAVPEPALVLWLAPLGAMGFVLWRRPIGRI
jgi:hypothetical protein